MFNILLKQQTNIINKIKLTSNITNISTSIINLNQFKTLSISSSLQTKLFHNNNNNNIQLQQCLNYSKGKEKEIKKKKQKIIKEKEKKRQKEIENTDFKTLPRSDLVYGKKDEDLKKLNLIIGNKSSKRLKDITRGDWHSRHQQQTTKPTKQPNNPITNVPLSLTLKLKKQQEELNEKKKNGTFGIEDLSKNKQFKQQQFDSKILEKIKEKKLGKFRQDKPKQGTTKLEVIRKEVSKDIERYFGSKLKLVGSAKQISSFLPETLPEVAFIGRSNVGKSSLINALTQRGLAKTSDKPGQTQSINWYELGSTLYLVDLPGYGFAFAKEDKLEQWSEITKHYLTQRSSNTLKCIFILIDSRHGLKDSDRQLLLELDKLKIKTHLILTKSDLIFQDDLAKRIHLTNEEIKNYHHSVLPCLPISSKNYAGISDLSKLIKVMKLKVKPIKINPNLKEKQILSQKDFQAKKLLKKEKKLTNLKKLLNNKEK